MNAVKDSANNTQKKNEHMWLWFMGKTKRKYQNEVAC